MITLRLFSKHENTWLRVYIRRAQTLTRWFAADFHLNTSFSSRRTQSRIHIWRTYVVIFVTSIFSRSAFVHDVRYIRARVYIHSHWCLLLGFMRELFMGNTCAHGLQWSVDPTTVLGVVFDGLPKNAFEKYHGTRVREKQVRRCLLWNSGGNMIFQTIRDSARYSDRLHFLRDIIKDVSRFRRRAKFSYTRIFFARFEFVACGVRGYIDFDTWFPWTVYTMNGKRRETQNHPVRKKRTQRSNVWLFRKTYQYIDHVTSLCYCRRRTPNERWAACTRVVLSADDKYNSE